MLILILITPPPILTASIPEATPGPSHQEEEDEDDEEEDEESEVLQCDFNPISQRLKKKKIDGNGFAAAKPSAGIKGSKHQIGDDPPPPPDFPQSTGLRLFPLTGKFTTTRASPWFPTMHCVCFNPTDQLLSV